MRKLVWMAAIVLALCVGGAPALAREAEEPPHIANPEWASKPSAESFEHAYPAAAREAGVEGRAVIECGVGASGSLTDCRVVSEEPSGKGFGSAALAMAWEFKIKPRMVDGRPAEGGVVRIPIRFQLGDEASSGGPEPAEIVMLAVVGAVLFLALVVWVVVPVGLICHGVRVSPLWSVLMLVPVVNAVFLWAVGLRALAVRREGELGKS